MAAKKLPPPDLPPDVTAADLEYPRYEDRADDVPMDVHYGLTFYKTTRLGWTLLTLEIRSGKRRYRPSTTDRSYGITMDGGLCRVGNGPHVLTTVKVHLTKSNIGRLRKYVDLWTKGMAAAGDTRDRISTRRAQGQAHRAAGRTSWMW